MGNRLDEIRTRQAEINTNLTDLELIADPSEDDQLRTDALIEEYNSMEEEAKPLQERQTKINAIREQFRNSPVGTEVGADTGHKFETLKTGMQVMSRVNPFEDLEGVRTGIVSPPQVRGRAEAAVEQFSKRHDVWGLSSDAAEEVTRKINKMGEKFGTQFARQVLTTGAPEYLQAFNQYLNDPTGYQGRAAMSLTAANGGYLVPFTLDPTVILTNNGSANPYRRLATVKTTTTNDWNGVTSAGVQAEWTAENIEAADASPTFGQLKITPQKADAYLFGSYEVLGDADFAAQLPGLLSDAKDRLEESAFASGTGTGQPFGATTVATVVNGGTGSVGTGVTLAHINSLISGLPARWRGPNSRVAFAANLSTIINLRSIPKFTGSTESLVGDGLLGFQASMQGIPMFESTTITGVAANNAKMVVYGDWSQYFIVDRVGMSVVYDPLVLGANRRPTGSGAWYSFWRVGANVSTPNALRALNLQT